MRGQLSRFLRFVVDRTVEGKGSELKESVIAVEVFGRGTDFDVSQDAAVRVYIHKLRRKFEEFYEQHPELGPARLSIPKGEYRLILEPTATEAAAATAPGASETAVLAGSPAPLQGPPDATRALGAGTSTEGTPTPQPRRPSHRNPWKIATFGALAALAAVAAVAALLWQRTAGREFARIRNNPVWAKLLDDTRPITVVLGDYYIFAEADELSQPKRLVREFSINSRADLDRYLMDHPEMSDKYMDAQLAYLPTSSAYVMADIMPVLASTHRPIHVTMMSELEPGAIKSTDLVYVGYLSGLGMLYDATFSGSRFSVGSSYDELLDGKTRTRYVSQAGDHYVMPADESSAGGGSLYREYSLVTGFDGPAGNHILIIAGMRDVGLMQAGEAVTGPRSLQQLSQRLPGGGAFEALYEVTGINSTNVASRLLVTSARKSGYMWNPDSGQPVAPADSLDEFPDGSKANTAVRQAPAPLRQPESSRRAPDAPHVPDRLGRVTTAAARDR